MRDGCKWCLKWYIGCFLVVARLVVAACEGANCMSEEANIVRLSAEDQRLFAKLLLSPPPLAPAMERAREHHARLIRSGE